ncbi:hypothetical protein BN1723_016286, partial [Verticillium longisporum]
MSWPSLSSTVTLLPWLPLETVPPPCTRPSCGFCGEYLPAAGAAGEEKAPLSRAPSTKKENVNQKAVLTAPIGFSHGCSVVPFAPIASIRHVARCVSHTRREDRRLLWRRNPTFHPSPQATMNPSLLVLVPPPLLIVASVSLTKAEVPVQMSALWLISACPRPAKFRAACLHTPSVKTPSSTSGTWCAIGALATPVCLQHWH